MTRNQGGASPVALISVKGFAEARQLRLEPLLQYRGDPRLADAGLSGYQHNLTFATLGVGPSAQQQLDFFVAATSGLNGRTQSLCGGGEDQPVLRQPRAADDADSPGHRRGGTRRTPPS